MTDSFKLFIATAGGLGLSPYFPGSCGALLGVAYHLAVAYLAPKGWLVPLLLAGLLAAGLANHVLTPWAERHWGEADSRHFVLDEVAGYLVVPLLFHGGEPWRIALPGYFLFRVFDIVKIPPANWIDRNIKTAWGVILDDVVSALYAVAVLYGARYAALLPGF